MLGLAQKIKNIVSRTPRRRERRTRKIPLEGIKRGETILRAKGITKRFPGVVANNHIDFEIKAGEIHAVLGENGAGKTTLMNILFGILRPDRGGIYVRRRRVEFKSPLDAIDLGIGMVHQHRKLIPAHTALENIILGHPKTGKIPDMRRAEGKVKELCRKYGFKIDLNARVWQLSAGEQQLVEILKALYRGAKLLILDEPTSVLTPLETERFLKSLRAMAKGELAKIDQVSRLGLVRTLDGEILRDVIFDSRIGEEYGLLQAKNCHELFKVGDRIEIIPLHCCGMVFLHDEIVGIRDDEVEVIWPISARGEVS